MSAASALAKELAAKLSALRRFTEANRNVHRALKDGIVEADCLSTKLRDLLAEVQVAQAMQAPTSASRGRKTSIDASTAAVESPPKATPAKKASKVPQKPVEPTSGRSSLPLGAGASACPVPAPRKRSSFPVQQQKQQQQQPQQQQPRQQRVKVRPTRRDAEIVASLPTLPAGAQGPSGTYASVLRRMMSAPDGMPNVKAVRCTHGGEIIFRLADPANLETVSKLIQEVAPEVGVRKRIPTVKVVVKDLHPGIDRSDISDSLAKAVGGIEGIRVGGLKSSYGGLRTCVAEVPWSAASRALIKSGKAQIGLTQCRVVAGISEERCFRCCAKGHRAGDCCGPDRSDLCWRCGEKGHKAVGCKKSRGAKKSRW